MLSIPPKMLHRERDANGVPLPWMESIVDGSKFTSAVAHNICWLCGESLYAMKSFALTTAGVITRRAEFPGGHTACIMWHARQLNELTAVYSTKKLLARNADGSRVGIDAATGEIRSWLPNCTILLDTPVSVSWWVGERVATRAKVIDDFKATAPALAARCATNQERENLSRQVTTALAYAPGVEPYQLDDTPTIEV